MTHPSKAAFPYGYDPVQYCHPNAENPIAWDEIEAYSRMHPLFVAINRLAKARIMQALLDLSSTQPIANHAFAWLFSDTSDFRAFCSDAGFAPNIVRHKAKEIIQDGLNWRADPRSGARYVERRSYRQRKDTAA